MPTGDDSSQDELEEDWSTPQKIPTPPRQIHTTRSSRPPTPSRPPHSSRPPTPTHLARPELPPKNSSYPQTQPPANLPTRTPSRPPTPTHPPLLPPKSSHILSRPTSAPSKSNSNPASVQRRPKRPLSRHSMERVMQESQVCKSDCCD